MPILETERLIVRPLQLGDHDFCQDLFRAIDWFDARLPDEVITARRASWFRWAMDSPVELARLYQPPLADRIIEMRATGDVVGLVGYVPALEPYGQLPGFGGRPGPRNTLEVGLFWAVHPKAQRHGIAVEAAGAMAAHAFDQLRLSRIVATTEHANTASIAVMRKLGMTIERNPVDDPPHFQTVGWIDAEA